MRASIDRRGFRHQLGYHAAHMSARAVCFVVLAVWIIGGPIYRQVLDRPAPLLFAWHMFHKRGLDVVEARFERQLPDGRRERIDRLRALGFARAWDAKLERRRIVGADGLRRAIAELCAKLAPGTDLRVSARLAIREGWRELERGDHDVCAAASH
jgi:hypothetical protein